MDTAQFQLHARLEERHWWFVGRRQIVGRLVREILPPDGQAAIADIGCGTAANLAALAWDYDCTGVDISPEAIGLAKQRYPALNLVAMPSREATARLVGQADLVMLLDVIEHVADDYLMLSQILADMSPGAHLLLTVPADESLWSEHDVSFGHYRRYDAERLAALWADLSVETRLLSPYNARLLPVIRWVRARGRRKGVASGASGTDFWIPPAPLNGLLTWYFAGEQGRLVRLLHGERARPYRAGASLIAVLRRGPASIEAREKPAEAPADHPQAPPAAEMLCAAGT